MDYVLCTSRIVAGMNLSLYSASGGNDGMTSLAAVSLYRSVLACKRRASMPSWCHISGRSTSVRRSSARVTGFRASILYAVAAIHDNVAIKKLQNVWFFNLCCFACDAMKLKSVKLITKHAPGDKISSQ